ncbi:MAG: hypothetical protein J5940_08015, partial [Clostridia bacterium]|nr:hypothetical protein [Clostridia bacterium]
PAPTKVTATIDMTDLYTLVIKTVGASGDDRTGVRAAAGKIQAGTYAANGRTRTQSFEFDFASLGFPGYAWEYLGAEVEIDTSGAEPKITSTPVKSTFCVTREQITFDESGKKATVCGVEFDISKINYGWLRPNTLLNEGGQFIPGWNDKASINSQSSTVFNSDKYIKSLYFFVNATQFDQQMLVCYADVTYDKNAPLPEGTAVGVGTYYGDTQPSGPSGTTTASGTQKVLVAGDFILFDNGIQDTIDAMFREGKDNEKFSITYDTITTAVPKTNSSRLEFYELFAFEEGSCTGWGTGARGQRMKGYFDEGVDVFVVTPGRREIGASSNAGKALSAAKWLSDTYPDVKFLFLEEHPYKDGTFGLKISEESSTLIGGAYTGSSTAEHLANIDAYLDKLIGAMKNKPTVIKFGTAFVSATADGIDLYGTETPFLTHSNASGSYLAACMIYTAITGKSAPDIKVEGVDTAAMKAIADKIAPATASGAVDTPTGPIITYKPITDGTKELPASVLTTQPAGANAIYGQATFDVRSYNIGFWGDALIYGDTANFFGAFCREDGKPITTLGGGSTYNTTYDNLTYSLYECFKWDGKTAASQITGIANSKLGNLLNTEAPAVDYYIAMTSRDRAIMNEDNEGRSLSAYKELYTMLKANNPDGKLVLLVPPGYQDGCTFFTEKLNMEPMTRKEHTEKLKDFAAKVIAECPDAIVIQAGDAFEFFFEKYASYGIELYRDNLRTTNEAGAYYLAALLYASIFRESPYGMEYSGYLSAEEAKILQEAAHEFVFGKKPTAETSHKAVAPAQFVLLPDERFPEQIFPKNYEALYATAMAYYERLYAQYDQLALNRVNYTFTRRTLLNAAPEYGTAQTPLFIDCTSFVWALLKTAFDYELPENRSKPLTYNDLGDLVVYEVHVTADLDIDAAIDAFHKTLQPGDVIAYSNPSNDRGHLAQSRRSRSVRPPARREI